MTIYEYAMMKVARQRMTEQELALARKLSDQADGGDRVALRELLRLRDRVLERPRKKRVKSS